MRMGNCLPSEQTDIFSNRNLYNARRPYGNIRLDNLGNFRETFQNDNSISLQISLVPCIPCSSLLFSCSCTSLRGQKIVFPAYASYLDIRGSTIK